MITPEGACTIERKMGGGGFAFYLVLPWTPEGQMEACLYTLDLEDVSN
jgi:hypothetical protein